MLALVVAVAALAAACGSSPDTVADLLAQEQPSTTASTGGATGETAVPATEPAPDGAPATTAPFGDDPATDLVTCDADLVGTEEGEVVAIHVVDRGRLDGLCYGRIDQVLLDAWDVLAAVVPPVERTSVTRFAGYAGAGDTLAFSVPITDDFREFLIAVDLDAAQADPSELQLTMLHEFAHVLTLRPDELDLDTGPVRCRTWWNGSGCVRTNGWLDEWITDFWPDAYLAGLPTDGSPDEDGGVDRCLADPGFLGSYAASSPEEDFAETFSAFVFDLEVPAGVQPKIDWFAAHRELAAFRERQRAAGLPPSRNQFDLCG